ncbi:MAG TPA: vitamin K epoxide reductase family protein [Terriglobia bacterium]|nr:vitamin K epoxide reductase family protein [Terriglobia bacterium]
MSDVTIRGIIVILALAGLANAFYFTLAYYGRVKKSRWVPEILCAPEGSSCVTVLQTSYARVFGVPNTLPGIAYYLLLLGWVVAGNSFALPWFLRLLIGAGACTVILGIYLMYALRFKLHTPCPLCYTAHAINTLLLVLLVLEAI